MTKIIVEKISMYLESKMILENIPTDNTVYAWCGEYFITLSIWQEKFPVEMICALHYAEKMAQYIF